MLTFCAVLVLYHMKLSEENTRALVTAMTRMTRVGLGSGVTLDIEVLTRYDGQGRCSVLEVCSDTRERHRSRLRRWAADKGWTVTWE